MTNLTVVPLYDFNVVLGIEFLEPSRLYAILGHRRIMDEGTPYMIPTVNVKTSVPTLSALQLVKGVKKGEKSFVAALVGDEVKSGRLSLIAEVLEKFKDVMPPKLPKRLPPRREVDHEIELVKGLSHRQWHLTECPTRARRAEEAIEGVAGCRIYSAIKCPIWCTSTVSKEAR